MSFIDEYTDFIFLEDAPQPSDVIFIPGSDEGALARRAAALWKEGLSPLVLPSGRYGKLVGRFTGDARFGTEWEFLHHILREEGVPEEAILPEKQATYTYENAQFSRKLLDAAGIPVQRALLCCQAYHARRAKLYYQVCFPEAEILVCPSVTKGIRREDWFLSERGIRTVLTEVEHCGTQFSEIFLERIRRN